VIPGFTLPTRPEDALRSLAPDLWVADRPLRLLGWLQIGTRMTVVRLPDGGVLLHSPVEPDSVTRKAVDALGPVRAIVAPNRVHHFFAAPWKAAYPDAALLAAPGLPQKRRDVAFDGELGDAPPTLWSAALDQHVFDGAPYLSEVVLLHRASRTLLLTDLAMNVTTPRPRSRALWFRLTGGYGRFGPNRVARACIRDRAAARRSVDRILGWDFDRITVTHGDVVERGGQAAFREAYAWL
jgi:hypothetical protein